MIFYFSSLFFVRNVIIKKLKMMFPPNFLTISQQSCWRWLVTYFYLMLSIIFGIPFQKKKKQQLGYSIKIYTCLVFLHPHNFTGQNHMDNPLKKYTWLESIPFSLEFECPFSFFFCFVSFSIDFGLNMNMPWLFIHGVCPFQELYYFVFLSWIHHPPLHPH